MRKGCFSCCLTDNKKNLSYQMPKDFLLEGLHERSMFCLGDVGKSKFMFFFLLQRGVRE